MSSPAPEPYFTVLDEGRGTDDATRTVVEASGLRVLSLSDEWPQFAHPRRPEFLLTLPHVHRTSGFFVARLACD